MMSLVHYVYIGMRYSSELYFAPAIDIQGPQNLHDRILEAQN